MKKLILLTSVLFYAFSFSQIQINEVDVDQTGTDTTEFIEISSDTPNFPLDGYLVVLYNGTDDQSYKTINLAGYTTDPNGFFIIGSNNIPNADITIGNSNIIQNGPDAIAIYQDDAANFPNGTAVTSTNLIDAIVYGTDDDDDIGLLDGLLQTIQYDEDLNGNKDAESIQNDGFDSFCVDLPTLRSPNSCVLGVPEMQSESIKIYPNPVTKGFVNITSNVRGIKNISIYDVLGKQIINILMHGEKLAISALRSGIYILKIEQGKTTTSKKLIVK